MSFTGSTAVGLTIQRVAGKRLARVSLELGGKNPLVVCDDADLDNAARWAVASAFSNAGQRCASGSRIIVFEAVADEFRRLILDRTRRLHVGPRDEDDLGPLISVRQLEAVLAAVDRARHEGATILCGGERMMDPEHRAGCYMTPTLIEGADPGAHISRAEVFGPVACIYAVKDFAAALALANDSPFGLTAAIHTRSLHRALRFAERVEAGIVSVNAGTYGSEPHLPFGGLKASGNGTREPGTEALDVYSHLKSVYLNVDPSAL